MSFVCYPSAVSDSSRVLVAVADQILRGAMSAILRGSYSVIEADKGELGQVRDERPDIVVLDPGSDVLDAIRSAPDLPYIPVLLVSPQNSPTDRAAGLRAGADDFVGVDMAEDELVARVDALLRVSRLAGPAGTELPDHAYLEKRLAIEFERASRLGEPLSLVAITAEPGSADEMSKQFESGSRRTDPITRMDGADLAVILRNTHFAGAITAVQRMSEALRGGDPPATRSRMGASCFPSKDVASAEELLSFARAALEKADGEDGAHVYVVQHETLSVDS